MPTTRCLALLDYLLDLAIVVDVVVMGEGCDIRSAQPSRAVDE